jgi:acetyltransferase
VSAWARTNDGVRYRIRTLTPADAAREREFILSLSPASRHARFMQTMDEPAPALVKRLVEYDPRRGRALAAVVGEGDTERIVGVARYGADEHGPDCEFAVAVADDWQCRGIGRTLTARLFAAAAKAGFREIYGTVYADNSGMLELARHLGLTVAARVEGEPTVRIFRRLAP